ncbi:LysR family transcriptional regulator [Antarcticimicrobium sediminis]|uniref:LysR family transcriptional regulator n=1 Tax=Antarcticimicrobium sediminis TaxID=2546227 RepID=A0A4R5ETV4_9RHOB|nr:LysR family transcriptional regulator [Antarcticimicrobium sediminis]TDE38315.1 LysR family transcriptional regulator [Antarcticimicrobium sediminis]
MNNSIGQRFPWNLDWNLLRTFMVIVEQQGVTKAADFLGLKQPTISSALRRLEETVGHRLIERGPHRFAVTAVGRTLYSESSTIFGAVSQLPELLEAEEEELSGHVNIALTSHVMSPHFDRVLEAFHARHSKVTYSIVVAESSDIVTLVRQNRASLGVCLLNKIPTELEARILFREYFGLYCGPRHRLFSRSKIDIGDLAGEYSVAFQTEIEGGPLDVVSGLRHRARLAPGLKGVSANLPEVRRMILANIGIGALPVHVAERDVRLGMLRQLPPYTKLPAVNIYLLSNPRRSLSPPEAALLRMYGEMIDETDLKARTYQ